MAVDTARPASHRHAAPQPGWLPQSSVLRRHRLSIFILMPLLAITGAVSGWNLQGWPGRVNDDEGTYVAQAWAVIFPHHLSHYTYWYDHPPLGWILMAGWIWLTHGFSRYPSAVMAGREFMWVLNLVSTALVYGIARRLSLRRSFAVAAALVFAVSPLAVYYHRMVFLDNIATMWMLAAFFFAASPRRSLAASFWSAAAFAIACLSKETVGVALPGLLWLLWTNTNRAIRSWSLSVFSATFVLLLLGYPMFAALRDELVPGPGHVSLLGALWWQFGSRPGSGSLLEAHSGTYDLAASWLGLDPWLPLAGLVLLPVAFAIPRLRCLAAGLVPQVLLLLKGGYVPYMYVTAMLPFAALIATGVADSWWQPALARRRPARSAGRPRDRRARPYLLRASGTVAVAAAMALLAAVVAPDWTAALDQQSHTRGEAASLAATAWINSRLPRGAVVVVDDYVWPDVTLHGKARPVWCWKVDGDPWVSAHVLPRGYKSIDYIVLPRTSSCELSNLKLPILVQALAHSRVVKRFGSGITARKVIVK